MSITVASVVVYRISLDFSPTNTHWVSKVVQNIGKIIEQDFKWLLISEKK